MPFQTGPRRTIYQRPSLVVDAATTAWVNKVNTLAGSSVVSNARKILVDALIVGLKTDGVFGGAGLGMDGIFVHAFADESQYEGRVSLINPTTVVAVPQANGGTFTLDANGWTGDGTKSFLDSSLVPGSLNFTVANALMASAILNNRTTVPSTMCSIGCFNSAGEVLILPNHTGNVFLFELNGATYPSAASSGTKAFWAVTRSSNSVINAYRNAANFDVGVTDAEGTNATSGLYIGAQNFAGTARDFSSDSIVASLVGASGTLTQVAALSNRINTALAGLPTPKNVY